MKIFLIGCRCTGKTTIGKILAGILKYSFLDIDKQIESESNSSIASIVKKSGWEKFRKLEKQALIKTQDKKDLIVSTGGGIILDIENQSFIKNNGIFVPALNSGYFSFNQVIFVQGVFRGMIRPFFHFFLVSCYPGYNFCF